MGYYVMAESRPDEPLFGPVSYAVAMVWAERDARRASARRDVRDSYTLALSASFDARGNVTQA